MDSGFQLPDSRTFFSGTWIPDSYICISDSKAQDSGFHQQKFPRFRIPHAKISRIKEPGFPYMWRNFVLQIYVLTLKSCWLFNNDEI